MVQTDESSIEGTELKDNGILVSVNYASRLSVYVINFVSFIL